jgi:hypothetical protein
MSNNTLENGQVTNANANEEKSLPAGSNAQAIVVKALKTNAGEEWSSQIQQRGVPLEC